MSGQAQERVKEVRVFAGKLVSPGLARHEMVISVGRARLRGSVLLVIILPVRETLRPASTR